MAVVAAAAVLAASAAAGEAAPPKAGQVVNFLAHCTVSHTSFDDPIVYPGQPGRSHHHTFFGSTSTNAFSTIASLRAAPTTCTRRDETAAYWVPTLFRSGRPVTPLRATAYYQLRQFQPIRAYPAGLKVVAGDAGATSPQPLRVVWWNCGAFGGVKATPVIPRRCSVSPPTTGSPRRPPGGTIELHVNFPDCWDGRRLDSPDHRSHMAYSENWRCPTTHPVAVPKLTLIVRYPTSDGRGLELASGGRYSAHADFINAWGQPELERIVADCARARPRCARGR
jgi:hypothetical protein